MEFSWTTFVLEMINFLVLVWILSRFLYKPVTEAVARRKAAIEATLAESKRTETLAQALKEQYEHRLGDWEREKEKARKKLLEEIHLERERLMAELHASLQQEREQAQVLEQRRLDELRRGIEEEALRQAGRFASLLLSRLASRELETKLIDLIVQDLTDLGEAKLKTLQMAYREGKSTVRVESAFPIGEAGRDALTRRINQLIGETSSFEFLQAPDLLAGLRISIGPWVLRANLKDELETFTKVAHGRGG